VESDIDDVEFHNQSELKGILKAVKTASKRPQTFKDCLSKARQKFQKLFHDNILTLLHVYPLDKLTADDRPFWSLPKRPPTP